MRFEKLKRDEELFRKKFKIELFWIEIRAIEHIGAILHYLITIQKRDDRRSQPKKMKSTLNIGFNRYRTRFLSRATSFFINVCNMEDIFKNLVKHQILLINQLSIKTNDEHINSVDQFINKMEDEISVYRFYRNKLFAHPAYIKPRDESESLKLTLLHYYAGELFGISKDSHSQLGGVRILDNGEFKKYNEMRKKNRQEFLNYMKKNTPPVIDLINDYSNLIEHYRRWEDHACIFFGFFNDM